MFAPGRKYLAKSFSRHAENLLGLTELFGGVDVIKYFISNFGSQSSHDKGRHRIKFTAQHFWHMEQDD